MIDGSRAEPDSVILVRSRLGLIALDAGNPAHAHETLAAVAAQTELTKQKAAIESGLRMR